MMCVCVCVCVNQPIAPNWGKILKTEKTVKIFQILKGLNIEPSFSKYALHVYNVVLINTLADTGKYVYHLF
jgi:hypothetical protein